MLLAPYISLDLYETDLSTPLLRSSADLPLRQIAAQHFILQGKREEMMISLTVVCNRKAKRGIKMRCSVTTSRKKDLLW